MISFDSNMNAIKELRDEYQRDVDIVRHSFIMKKDVQIFNCQLDSEMQPPMYRKDVQEMIKKGKTQQNPFTKIFRYNSGLTYYPFQK